MGEREKPRESRSHRALRHSIELIFPNKSLFLKFARGQIRAKLGPIQNFHPMGGPYDFS